MTAYPADLRMDELPLLGNEDSDVTEDQVFQGACDQQSNGDAYKEDDDSVKDFKYDVFISYSKNDRPWVKDVLLQTLEQEGKKVCIDYRDFQPGVPVTDNVVHAIENSQVTVLVLTPAFVESEWCMYESKQALVSSLATAKARVLPLILMECNMPNILKHLTYLDHTSEDVQPYFKEQLIDCLNNADKWILSAAANHLRVDIVPISEVQQVVTRSLDQDKQHEIAVTKLIGAFSSLNLMKRRIKCGLALPCCIMLIGYLIYIIMYIDAIASYPIVITPLKPTTVNYTSSNIFYRFNINNTVATKCDFLTTKKQYLNEPILVDLFGFNDFRKNVLYGKENSTHLMTSLHPLKWFKQPRFRIHGDMSMTTKFCFRSQDQYSKQNAKLRLYKPTTTIDTNQFDKTTDPEHISEVKYEDYESSASENSCLTSVIKGQSLTSNDFSAFVFYNPGKTPLFLNLTTTFKTPNFRKSSAFLTCRNVSECKLPSSPRIKYVIISTNISTPSYSENDITVKCVYTKPVVLFTIIMVMNLLFWIIMPFLVICLFNKKGVPRLQKWYFGREIVRDKLGEDTVQMIEDSANINELYKTVKQEREKKEFRF